MNDRQYVYIFIGKNGRTKGRKWHGREREREKGKQSFTSMYYQSDEQYIKDS